MAFKKTTKEEKRTREFVDTRDKTKFTNIHDDPRGQETIERAINEILKNPNLLGFNMVAVMSKGTSDPRDINIMDVGGGLLNPLQQIVLAKSLQDAAERAMRDTEELLKHIEEKIAKKKEK